MSRVTPPVTKLAQAVRRISSTQTANRSSTLLDSQARSAYLPRSRLDLKAECSKRQLKTNGNKAELVERLAAADLINNSHGFHTLGDGHRPAAPVTRTIPLMQTFRSSAPKQAVRDASTMDHFTFPQIPDVPSNPFAKLRVPLLPDNYSPDRSPESGLMVEAADEAVFRPEINVCASHPENVAPAALSEVVGNEALEVDLGQLTAGFSSSADADSKEPGVLKELWSGLVDDLIGSKAGSPKLAI
ncbi:Uncharacterized protein BP5553_05365 [Venustampulla echinocandica]|uniref:SAP domain-containing protein n=1 Tax=Venustampulla echinocandica TaxID=2656787 RepID=A0A370TQY8_9HELO|nr:Uncharacterized protein BP5553_05365 [Venustampulla echinocandica]RDL37932.1 Uncharacterized protein BP5553_05365 [Venustampulla echinocandica]